MIDIALQLFIGCFIVGWMFGTLWLAAKRFAEKSL